MIWRDCSWDSETNWLKLNILQLKIDKKAKVIDRVLVLKEKTPLNLATLID